MADQRQHRYQDQHQRDEATPLDCSEIKFSSPLDPELFNGIARKMAKTVANADRNANKPTQLRRFYDEVVLWEMRVSRQPEKFSEFLPFIRMINAKAAYAEGRKPKLVDRTFVDLLQKTLQQVTDAATLTTCKLFWEAFMGFYKQERQD